MELTEYLVEETYYEEVPVKTEKKEGETEEKEPAKPELKAKTRVL